MQPGALGLLAALAAFVWTSPGHAGVLSGLPWPSGAKSGRCLADQRHRPLDVVSVHIAPPTVAGIVVRTAQPWVQRPQAAPTLVIGMGMPGGFVEGARGDYDDLWRQVAQNLQRASVPQIVVRLAWEANLGSRTHAWGVDTAAQTVPFRAYWRRVAQILRSDKVLMEFSSAKKWANRAFRFDQLYPGDDLVDYIGVHQYDSAPQKATLEIWNRYLPLTYNGSPWGLDAWLSVAESHGKKLGIGEWGPRGDPGMTLEQIDNPVFVEGFHQWLVNNAESVAYESEQNSQPEHQMCAPDGSRPHPRASEIYFQLWGAPAIP